MDTWRDVGPSSNLSGLEQQGQNGKNEPFFALVHAQEREKVRG